MSLCVIAGARPNFIKLAPVLAALRDQGISHFLVHTGQHADSAMSDVFFHELGIPPPAAHLGIGVDAPVRQVARILLALDELWRTRRPRLVLVAGDVTSTLAGALAAAKADLPVAHLEAGLRSFDRSMPEELNRMLTDQMSALLFTTEAAADRNLAREGIAADRIRFVGNCMVDTLDRWLPAALEREPWKAYGMAAGHYVLATLHRPANVDTPAALRSSLAILGRVAARLPVLLPVHPRTARRIADDGLLPPAGVQLLEPQPYLANLGLMARARLVLTDSGGIQEETTALGVPCLTLRDNTERPATLVEHGGTSRLVGRRVEAVLSALDTVLAGGWPPGNRPLLWDGQAGRRVAAELGLWLAAETTTLTPL
jgi:UDP-N-acetylglucosamine 2-epimerase (non-hydrolysing)